MCDKIWMEKNIFLLLKYIGLATILNKFFFDTYQKSTTNQVVLRIQFLVSILLVPQSHLFITLYLYFIHLYHYLTVYILQCIFQQHRSLIWQVPLSYLSIFLNIFSSIMKRNLLGYQQLYFPSKLMCYQQLYFDFTSKQFTKFDDM